MIKRILFLTAVLGLILAACTGPSSPPLVKMDVAGTVVDGFQSSYCWDSGTGGTLCVDSIEPQLGDPHVLAAGEPIKLELETPLPDSVNLSLSEALFTDFVVSESVSANEAISWSPAVDSGEYVLSVHVAWEQGDVTYWFPVSLTAE